MAQAPDMMNTIELISDFWPHLKFEKADLISGNLDFIVRFYTMFIAEINEKILYLINEETALEEFEDSQEFEVVLYCKVSKILKKMKQSSLNLADFYIPNPKKMYPLIKCSIHFVIYINNCLDKMSSILNENLKKLVDNENFKVLKEQCLQDTAENAEEIARTAQANEKLKIKLEEINKKHEEMTIDKIADEKLFLEKSTELNGLQNELDNFEYDLKFLEDKEEELKECVITEQDFQNLRNTEKYLEIEHQELCTDDFDIDEEIEIENVKRLEEYAQKLASLRLNSLDVETLHALRQEAKQFQEVQKKLSDDLSALNNASTSITKNIEKEKRELEKTERIYAKSEKKVVTEEQNEQKSYNNAHAKCVADFEKCQTLKSQMLDKQEEMRQIERDEHKLAKTVAQEYQKVLNIDKETTKKFHNILQSLLIRERL